VGHRNSSYIQLEGADLDVAITGVEVPEIDLILERAATTTIPFANSEPTDDKRSPRDE